MWPLSFTPHAVSPQSRLLCLTAAAIVLGRSTKTSHAVSIAPSHQSCTIIHLLLGIFVEERHSSHKWPASVGGCPPNRFFGFLVVHTAPSAPNLPIQQLLYMIHMVIAIECSRSNPVLLYPKPCRFALRSGHCRSRRYLSTLPSLRIYSRMKRFISKT